MTVLRMLTVTGIVLAGLTELVVFHYLVKAVFGRMSAAARGNDGGL